MNDVVKSEPVTVLETYDPLLPPVVQSLLEAEGIPCFVLNEFTQDLIGSRVLLGGNQVLGPIRIEVDATNEEAARELIAHHISTIETDDAEAVTEAPEAPETSN
jgi:hypothetical protein